MNVCDQYTGVTCIDGSCPMAMREDYAEHGIPVVSCCGECHLRKGCEGCAWKGTEYCEKETTKKS